MDLEIEIISENKDTSIIELSGEIDIYTATKLKEAILPLTEQAGHLLKINFENVNYMDSTGLGIFISVLKSTRENDSHFKLLNLQERVLRLFTITGLNEIMEISTDQKAEVVNNDGTI